MSINCVRSVQRGARKVKTNAHRTPWGKRREDGTWHPLIDHCLDVAIVFRRLLDVSHLSWVKSLNNLEKDRLAVLAFLHDFGKCNRGFQAKSDPLSRETAGHVLEAAAWLFDQHELWPEAWCALLQDIIKWFDGDESAVVAMLLASISHHGRPVSGQDYASAGDVQRKARRNWQSGTDDDPIAAVTELSLAARAAFPAAFSSEISWKSMPPLVQQRFAGLVMLADWIGSDTQFFPYRQSPQEDRRKLADHAAKRALRSIGILPPCRRQVRSFIETFGFAPSELQQAISSGLSVNEESRILLVESDTGSGKTEAALAWFFRLYASEEVDGLYFALPTRVAARELYARVLTAIEAAFDSEDRPCPVILAAPGYVRVDGQPMLPDSFGVLWDDNVLDRRREKYWSAERPKRFLAAPIGVGTVDQALLSVLQVKHSLLRSVCLDRHLLVVDEVHASDAYMREVLCALISGHVGRGGWVLLLSATLGESAAARFLGRELMTLTNALRRPYPLLTSRSDNYAMVTLRKRCLDVELSPSLNDDDALVPRLLAALRQGARVMVICNTVTRANTLFRRIEAVLEAEQPELLEAVLNVKGIRCPHHGRFARADRELLDAAVSAALGKYSQPGARLLIGTQTLEQSLDIDADWLVTDLAPMDMLLQRFGRLHRHPREDRPAVFATPQACVRVPAADLSGYLRSDGSFRGPAGLGSVYVDGRVLMLTLSELMRRPRLSLPEDARTLIEYTTHPEVLAAMSPNWRAHGAHIEGKDLAEVRLALTSVLDQLPFGELHYADKSERIVTRLGQPSFDLSLQTPRESAFGATIDRVIVPAHWVPEGVTPEIVSAEVTEAGFRFDVATKAFRYSRFGLEKDHA